MNICSENMLAFIVELLGMHLCMKCRSPTPDQVGEVNYVAVAAGVL